MNKLVSKKTARFLAVVLAILVVVNVLPFGVDKTLQARAEGEEAVMLFDQPLRGWALAWARMKVLFQ